MKYSKKLYKKFFKQRVFGWDLHKLDEDGDNKIVRFIRGDFVDAFTEEEKSIKLPQIMSGSNFQIFNKTQKMNWIDAYLLARRIQQKNCKYKVRVGFILKVLRNE